MCKKTLYAIIMVCVFFLATVCCAQESMVTSLGEAPKAASNPFIPKFPIEKKEEKEPIKEEGPEVIEKSKQPPPKSSASPEKEEKKVDLGTPALTITGLIWNSDRPQAIVNGNVVEIGYRMFSVPSDKGEKIPEIKIVNIDKEGLSVAYDGKTVILKPEMALEKEQK